MFDFEKHEKMDGKQAIILVFILVGCMVALGLVKYL